MLLCSPNRGPLNRYLLTDVLLFESGQALFDVASIVPDRFQRSANIFPNVLEASFFYMESQLHQCRLEGQLVAINPIEHICQRVFLCHGYRLLSKKIKHSSGDYWGCCDPREVGEIE